MLVRAVCSNTDWLATVSRLDEEKVGASGFSPVLVLAAGGGLTGSVEGGFLGVVSWCVSEVQMLV